LVGDSEAPRLEFVARVVAEIGAPIDSGRGPNGKRQMIPITGGSVDGPKLRGRILPGGADFQVFRSDGVVEIEARYFVETDAGERVFIHNAGIAHGIGGALYFRTSPRFETASESLRWLTQSQFVATGTPRAGAVELEFFRVL
jgi:Protein of unknown function (DUF3237)